MDTQQSRTSWSPFCTSPKYSPQTPSASVPRQIGCIDRRHNTSRSATTNQAQHPGWDANTYIQPIQKRSGLLCTAFSGHCLPPAPLHDFHWSPLPSAWMIPLGHPCRLSPQSASHHLQTVWEVCQVPDSKVSIFMAGVSWSGSGRKNC